MEPLGHKSLVVNVVVVGLFEEEEEWTGIASDVGEGRGSEHPRFSEVCRHEEKLRDRTIPLVLLTRTQ